MTIIEVAARVAFDAYRKERAKQGETIETWQEIGKAKQDRFRAIAVAFINPTPLMEALRQDNEHRDLLDWLDERASDGSGQVRLGLTDNGEVGCWLPGDTEVPEGGNVEEAVRFRMERWKKDHP